MFLEAEPIYSDKESVYVSPKADFVSCGMKTLICSGEEKQHEDWGDDIIL